MFFRPRGSSNILTESIRLEWSFLWLNLPKGRPCLTLAGSGASLCFTLVSFFSAYPLLGVKNAAFPGFVSSYSWHVLAAGATGGEWRVRDFRWFQWKSRHPTTECVKRECFPNSVLGSRVLYWHSKCRLAMTCWQTCCCSMLFFFPMHLIEVEQTPVMRSCLHALSWSHSSPDWTLNPSPCLFGMCLYNMFVIILQIPTVLSVAWTGHLDAGHTSEIVLHWCRDLQDKWKETTLIRTWQEMQLQEFKRAEYVSTRLREFISRRLLESLVLPSSPFLCIWRWLPEWCKSNQSITVSICRKLEQQGHVL